MTTQAIRRTATLFVALAMLALACGDDGSPPAETPPSSPSVVVTATPTLAPNPNEHGTDPMYYRAADDFTSVVAGEPYTVVFRVTNGFEGDTLVITATPEGGGEPVSFSALRSEPVGTDAPGSYYPVNIELPAAGMWTLAVSAGEDDVSMPISVAVAPG